MPISLPRSAPAPLSQVEEHAGLPAPRRYWAMLALFAAIIMAVMDGVIATVALPTIARDLGVSAADSIWVVNAYQLSILVVVLPLSALGDRIGYRRVSIVGLGIFCVGSAACALADSLPVLIAARVLQGLGGAGVMAVNGALVRHIYPANKLGQGIGINASVVGVAAAAGPTAASAVLSVADWHWLFAANVPIGLLAIGVGVWAFPRTEGSGKPFDWPSAVLNAFTFGLLALGAEGMAREPSALAAAELLLGMAAAVILVRRERGRPDPLIPLDLLRLPMFRLSVATSVMIFAAQGISYLALPFLFQESLGRSVLMTGLLLTPWALAAAVMSPITGRLSERYAAGLLCAIGGMVFALGLGLLAMLDKDASNLEIALRILVCGVGFGFFQTPNNRTLLSAAPLRRSGAAAGSLAMARLLGQVTGASATAVFFHLLGPSSSQAALIAAAGFALLAAAVSSLRLRVTTAPSSAPPTQADQPLG